MSEKWLILKRFYIKLTHWEYWPFHMVYAPMVFYYLYLSLRAKSLCFFNAANPLIRNGGFLQESKKEIYDLLPASLYPKTLLFHPDCKIENLLERVRKEGLSFPFIAKPDTGQRGLMVKLIKDRSDLKKYLSNITVPFLIQKFVDLPEEVGIFYCRIPGQSSGKITGVVGKEFLKVIGDGHRTVEQLLIREPRFLLQLAPLRISESKALKVVLSAGEEKILVPFGNHSRGAKFIDLTHLADSIFRNHFEAICQSIPEFYFGRLDIKYLNWEDLKVGKNFSIIELNGAGSEPTHMYDPKYSVFHAWKQIIYHLNLLYKIRMQNSQEKGIPFMAAKDGLQMLKENWRHKAHISKKF
ncbi:hypothetical protein [Dyadobacter tibetensis]|uniref:hypothetical protein n=1 Tax=Dyadobacter tibetensis TaxID=1211851 RepID=UPI00046EFAAE|nr:hypothetical protein [Dyadobacter tibetensis]